MKPQLTRAALLLALVFFVSMGIYAFLLPGIQDARLPSEASARHCGERLAAGFKDGDLVRIEPSWYSTTQRLLLGALEERSHYPFRWFDERDPLVPEHHWRFKRLWILHAHELSGRDLEDILPVDHRITSRYTCGKGLVLALVDLPQAELRFDMIRDLPKAVVRRQEAGKKPRPCRWTGSGHDCGGKWWQDVRALPKDAGGSRRECVFLEPAPDKGRVEIGFPKVRFGARTVIWGGLSISGARRDAGGDIRLEVRVGDALVVDHVEPRAAYRWQRFELDTSEVQGRELPLVFTVSAKKSGWRQFCLDAVSVDEVVPERRSGGIPPRRDETGDRIGSGARPGPGHVAGEGHQDQRQRGSAEEGRRDNGLSGDEG